MTKFRCSLAVILVLGCAGFAWADVRDTKHNLSGSIAEASASGRKGEEVCVFCHTPGGVEASEGEALGERRVAKWNSSLEAAFSFEMFDDIGAGGALGSVSVACLSCHDSAQAFGISPGGNSDHPFGVPYRGATMNKGQSASQFRDDVLGAVGGSAYVAGRIIDDASEFRPVRSGVVNKREVWWASRSEMAQRSKNDLPLAPRRVAIGKEYQVVPFVECTSCHDPHSSREVFLRNTNEQSKICLTCHVK